MFLSIIIPIYNAEKYLHFTLKSCIEQKSMILGKDYEIICVNDGSKDASLSIIGKFQQDGIRLITQDNQGVSVARNTGLKQATGDWIWFVDADDIISPDAIQTLFDTIKQDDYQIAEFKVQKQDSNGKSLSRPYWGSDVVWGCICKRLFLNSNHLFFSTAMHNLDEDTLWRCEIQFALSRIKGKAVKITSKVLYTYVIHEDSLVRSNHSDKLKKYMSSQRALLQEYQRVKQMSIEYGMDNWTDNMNSRISRTIVNMMFNALRTMSAKEREAMITDFKNNGLYPFPFIWEYIYKSGFYGWNSFRYGWFCFLFPCEWYYRFVGKITDRIKKQ